MGKHDKKSSGINYEELFIKIATPKFIIRFDATYISILILLPFILSLLNWWHFSKITPNQMLSYVGSITTAFCTINLSFVTLWLAFNTKRESDKLKRRVILNGSMYEDIFINQNRSKIEIDIPVRSTTDYINSVIKYDVEYLRVTSGLLRKNFYKGKNLTQKHSDKNTSSPLLRLELTLDETKDIKLTKYMKLNISVNVINEGIETKNELGISATRTDFDDLYFNIIKAYQLWSM